ncbi:MAG: hypothetical protein ABI763_03285 [Bacteroidota bacterium]
MNSVIANYFHKVTDIPAPPDKTISMFLFGIVTLFIFWNVGIFKHIHDKPNSIHTWAQCDRASVAACYYNESMNFLKPRVYNRGNGTSTGICGMEFPLINYSAALCYKFFGFHEFYYRLINFILLFAGLLSAFLMADLFLRDVLFSAIVVWLFMLSPILVFYSANFLPDSGSLGLVLISWYFFFSIGTHADSRRRLMLFFIFITVACLIKLTSMVSLITMIILIAGKRIRFLKTPFIPGYNREILTGFVVCFVLVFGWYRYAAWLNDTYQNYFFILKGNAVQTFQEFIQVLTSIYVFQYKDYYPFLIKIMILVCFVVFVITNYFQNRLLAFTFCLQLMGFAGFAMTMLRQFQDHDYYIIPMLPLIFFLFLTTAEIFIRILNAHKILHSISIILLLVLVNVSMVVCKKSYQNDRYAEEPHQISYSNYDKYIQVSPYLDTLNVGKNDLVLSYHDGTPNVSLYLMNRKGSTIAEGDFDRLKSLISTNNFKYLILNDTANFTGEMYESLQDKKIGNKYNVQIYQLKK